MNVCLAIFDYVSLHPPLVKGDSLGRHVCLVISRFPPPASSIIYLNMFRASNTACYRPMDQPTLIDVSKEKRVTHQSKRFVQTLASCFRWHTVRARGERRRIVGSEMYASTCIKRRNEADARERVVGRDQQVGRRNHHKKPRLKQEGHINGRRRFKRSGRVRENQTPTAAS